MNKNKICVWTVIADLLLKSVCDALRFYFSFAKSRGEFEPHKDCIALSALLC